MKYESRGIGVGFYWRCLRLLERYFQLKEASCSDRANFLHSRTQGKILSCVSLWLPLKPLYRGEMTETQQIKLDMIIFTSCTMLLNKLPPNINESLLKHTN